jgi:two-component system phosphate regulon sensor histidine kinase PhoR
VDVRLECHGACHVAGDADELLQVAQNLLENALKYGGGGGRVEITCERNARDVILTVRDWGKGIAAVHLPRLTERFYRVSTQESRARGGTGLGLAIVKHIVLRHRGHLAIASEAGQGSTFSVSIPAI